MDGEWEPGARKGEMVGNIPVRSIYSEADL